MVSEGKRLHRKKKERGKITRPPLIGPHVPRVCPGSENGGLMCVWSAAVCRRRSCSAVVLWFCALENGHAEQTEAV